MRFQPSRASSPSPGVAWYDQGAGWVRDAGMLLHLPYTAWHLSYVALGAGLASDVNWTTFMWTMLAFFLAMGIAAHCLDELQGRPLKTSVPSWVLVTTAVVSLAGACAIGIVLGLAESMWLLPFILFGGFIAVAYNLELWIFHHDYWFGFAWGSFPVLTAYFAQEEKITVGIVLVALSCLWLSLAQRTLSKHVRHFRRRVAHVEGRVIEWSNNRGYVGQLTQQMMILVPEQALRGMTLAMIALGVGVLVRHG